MRNMPDKYNTYFIYLALTIVTFAVFWQVHTFDFVNYDDDKYVSENQHISSGVTLNNVVWLFTKDIGRWHPLTGLTQMLDCELFGLNPGRHHLVNLFFHIINTLLLFAVLRQITGALWRSAFVAALFAIHPLHVESVAWISGRKDLLSTLLLFLTIAAYLRYVKNHSLGWYVLVLGLFVLGLLAKPMLITLPFLLLLLDYWPLQRFQRKIPLRLVWEKLPFLALSIGSTVATFFIQRSIGAVRTIESIPLTIRAANAVVSYMKYIGKLIWPQNLAVFYPYSENIVTPWLAVTFALVLLAVTLRIIFAADKFKYLLVGWLWFIVTLVPVIGLVRVGDFAMADRYTYVSLIGLFIIIAWGANDLLARWKHRRLILSLTALVVIAALAVASGIQTGYWRDSVSLFEHALKVTKGNYVANANLGAALLDQNKFEQAIQQLQLAIETNPNCAEAYCNLADVYRKLGRYPDAIQVYNRVVQVRPNYAPAYYELGITYDKLGQYQQAIQAYASALEVKSDYAQAYSNLGVAYGRLGQWQNEIDVCITAIKIDPTFAEAYNNLGVALAQFGRFPESIQAFGRAIRLNPNFAEAHLGLGAAHLMSGDKNSAMKDYEILKALDPQKANLLLNLLNQQK
jgi:tetratricopeptide (TPR) repeat protein